MDIFLSKFTNKIDKKGRVSIPATYRSILAKEDVGGVVVYPSFKNQCIEVCSMSHLQNLNQLISELDPYSEERDAFETVVLSESIHLQFDNEGRVSLPAHLIEIAGIDGNACIVGKGRVFEIWHPDNFAKHLQHAKEMAQNNRALLRSSFDKRGRGE